jgi:hypothetical protein
VTILGLRRSWPLTGTYAGIVSASYSCLGCLRASLVRGPWVIAILFRKTGLGGLRWVNRIAGPDHRDARCPRECTDVCRHRDKESSVIHLMRRELPRATKAISTKIASGWCRHRARRSASGSAALPRSLEPIHRWDCLEAFGGIPRTQYISRYGRQRCEPLNATRW